MHVCIGGPGSNILLFPPTLILSEEIPVLPPFSLLFCSVSLDLYSCCFVQKQKAKHKIFIIFVWRKENVKTMTKWKLFFIVLAKKWGQEVVTKKMSFLHL